MQKTKTGACIGYTCKQGALSFLTQHDGTSFEMKTRGHYVGDDNGSSSSRHVSLHYSLLGSPDFSDCPDDIIPCHWCLGDPAHAHNEQDVW